MERNEQRDAALDGLLDRQAITDCLIRYARGIDRHDDDMVASAYHDDAIDDHTTYIGSGRGLAVHASAAHDLIWKAHQHFVTNITIDLNGDEAHAESYWIVAGRRIVDASLDLHGGRYLDRFERRGGEWRIAARICAYEWGLRPEDVSDFLVGFPVGAHDKSDVSYQRPLRVERDTPIKGQGILGPSDD
jgi:hypothetical protein